MGGERESDLVQEVVVKENLREAGHVTRRGPVAGAPGVPYLPDPGEHMGTV